MTNKVWDEITCPFTTKTAQISKNIAFTIKNEIEAEGLSRKNQ